MEAAILNKNSLFTCSFYEARPWRVVVCRVITVTNKHRDQHVIRPIILTRKFTVISGWNLNLVVALINIRRGFSRQPTAAFIHHLE